MKKILLVLIAALTFILPAGAQVRIGIMAGMNITKPIFNQDIFNPSNRCGFFIGPQADISLTDTGLGLDIAVLYDRKNVRADDNDAGLEYIDLPINAKFTLGFGEMANMYVSSGPQFSWNVGGKNIFDETYTLRTSLMSWNAGVGFTILGNIRLGYTFNIPFGRTAEFNGPENISFKNRNHRIHATYFF